MKLLDMSVALLVLVPVAAAQAVGGDASPPIAVVSDVLAGQTMSGQAIPCTTRPDGISVCHGESIGPGGSDLRLKSFDGMPLDVWVTLPPVPATGVTGDYPLVVQNHGWSNPPSGPDDTQYDGPTAAQWAQKGYLVMQFAARGWGDSCGTDASRQVNPAACVNGYLRLDDDRYEVRDVQYAVGLLVDEGLADPGRIGVTGESYGAGASLALATLNDRVMNENGTLSPWTSPGGTPLHIAAAVPVSGWSDLASALMPNGRTLDSQITSTTDDFTPVGVWKQSIDTGLYILGNATGYFAPQGINPQADVTTWFATMGVDGPHNTPEDAYIIDQATRYHSPYYLLAGDHGVARQAPAPMLLAAGFTDAVFPPDEFLRYANLEKSLYPANPLSLFFYDGGHQRGQNKPADSKLLVDQVAAYFDHYVKGGGPEPVTGVTALTQTCPLASPSGGPFHATTWEALHPGEVRFSSAPAQTVLSSGGDAAISKSFDPIFGGHACTTAPAADQVAGVATYRFAAATGPGYTLLGSPIVTADLDVRGTGAYVAARLLDVDPATDTETLIARGVYRFDPTKPSGRQAFQLSANGWHFAAGHIPKLELLGQDSPFLLASTTAFSVTASNLALQLPVHEIPCTPGVPAATRTCPATAASPVFGTPTFTG